MHASFGVTFAMRKDMDEKWKEGKVAIYCDTHFVLRCEINFLCIAIYRKIVTTLSGKSSNIKHDAFLLFPLVSY